MQTVFRETKNHGQDWKISAEKTGTFRSVMTNQRGGKKGVTR